MLDHQAGLESLQLKILGILVQTLSPLPASQGHESSAPWGKTASCISNHFHDRSHAQWTARETDARAHAAVLHASGSCKGWCSQRNAGHQSNCTSACRCSTCSVRASVLRHSVGHTRRWCKLLDCCAVLGDENLLQQQPETAVKKQSNRSAMQSLAVHHSFIGQFDKNFWSWQDAPKSSCLQSDARGIERAADRRCSILVLSHQ